MFKKYIIISLLLFIPGLCFSGCSESPETVNPIVLPDKEDDSVIMYESNDELQDSEITEDDSILEQEEIKLDTEESAIEDTTSLSNTEDINKKFTIYYDDYYDDFYDDNGNYYNIISRTGLDIYRERFVITDNQNDYIVIKEENSSLLDFSLYENETESDIGPDLTEDSSPMEIMEPVDTPEMTEVPASDMYEAWFLPAYAKTYGYDETDLRVAAYSGYFFERYGHYTNINKDLRRDALVNHISDVNSLDDIIKKAIKTDMGVVTFVKKMCLIDIIEDDHETISVSCYCTRGEKNDIILVTFDNIFITETDTGYTLKYDYSSAQSINSAFAIKENITDNAVTVRVLDF